MSSSDKVLVVALILAVTKIKNDFLQSFKAENSWPSNQRSQSKAAIHPDPAAVTACL